MRNNTPLHPPKGFFYTDAIADHAIQFIRKAAAQEKPLFLYVAFTAPHYPLHAREETIETYNGVYDDGWDVIRRCRFEKLNKMGLIGTDARLAPRDPAGIPWEDEPHKAWQAHRMQVYAAMVTEMDAAIGRIVEALTATGKLENTLLVFLSDNGGSNEGHLHNTIERMKKPWTSSMIPENAPDGTPVRAGDWPGEKLGGPATYGSYGLCWANVSNTPFRRHKSWVHEGGISTPCIIHWPVQIKISSITHQPAHLIDLMPTLAEVGSTKRPMTEGRSLIPVCAGKAIGNRAIGWEHEGNRAFRIGNWKIVSEFPGTWKTMYPYPKQGRWELYNLETDRSELNDLAEKHPEKLNELTVAYEKWAKRVGVVAWENLESKRE